MPKVHVKDLCACGAEAVVSISKDGVTTHKCLECLRKPPTLREKDTKMLYKLGLIA